MSKKCFLLFAIILSGCATSKIARTTSTPPVQNNKLAEKLIGIWEFSRIKTSNSPQPGFVKAQRGQFKVYGGDSTFTNFGVSMSSAVISSEGKWEAISDSVIVEHVNRSMHQGLIGKNDTLYFKLNNQGVLYLKWHRTDDNNGNPADVWVEELWRKIDLPQEAGSNPVS